MTKTIAKIAPALLALFALNYVDSATAFSLKDPKGVNSIRFTLDGRFEHISGYTTAIDGNVMFDPASPEKLTGTVTVQAGSLVAHNASLTEHMKQPMWLDSATHPTITFSVTKVADLKPIDGPDKSWSMDVTGDFTLRGVTKSLTVPVKVTHMPGQLSKRNRVAGDLMAIRTSFVISRKDFGVDGNQPLDIVADEVRVDLSIAAFAPKAN